MISLFNSDHRYSTSGSSQRTAFPVKADLST